MDKEYMLEVNNLKQYFTLGRKYSIKAVDDISFNIRKGEIFALVGESGSGKSTIGRTIIGINRATEGRILFKGKELSNKKRLKIFKRKQNTQMQFIFQDSTSSLNPRMTIGEIIGEPFEINKLYRNKAERKKKVLSLMNDVGLNEDYIDKYPYDFSGGQRQRVGIARALALDPEFIIADEPISSLDVSMQAQIVNLFSKLNKERDLTILFIAHDLSMVSYLSHRIGVMNKGKIVEIANTEELYKRPIHPYTKSLLSSILQPNPKFKNINRVMNYDNSYDSENGDLREISNGHFVYGTKEELEIYLKK